MLCFFHDIHCKWTLSPPETTVIFPKSFLHPGAGFPPPFHIQEPWLPKLAKEQRVDRTQWELSPWLEDAPSSVTSAVGGRQHLQGEPGMSLNLQLTKQNLHLLSQVFSKPFEREQNLLEASAQSFGGGYVQMPLVRSVILLRGVKRMREAANYLRHIAGDLTVPPHFLQRHRCCLSPQQTCFLACSHRNHGKSQHY